MGAGRPVVAAAAGASVGLSQPARVGPGDRPEPSAEHPQRLCLDGGYAYPWVDELALGRGFTPDIRRRSDELELKRSRPGWRARRWVVEACHSWLNRNRALLIRWSKKPENHLALL